jgi:hypothetical protein
LIAKKDEKDTKSFKEKGRGSNKNRGIHMDKISSIFRGIQSSESIGTFKKPKGTPQNVESIWTKL